jgi:protein phosphatase
MSEVTMTTHSAVFEVIAAIRTDAGCRREHNEDSVVFIRPGDVGMLSSKGVLTVVADGMGGHSAGEMASRIAVEIIGRRYFESSTEWRSALVESIHDANAAILERSRREDWLSDMGTTCTALAIREGFAWCGHVGDSRLYLVRDGQIYAMTQNHSAVMERVRMGLLTREEARRHEDRNVIVRSLGSRADLCVDTWDEPLPLINGDRFVLCSDGLYDIVEDSEINMLVAKADPFDAAQRLIALTRERGAPDNVTAAIVGLQTQSHGEPVKETRERGVLQ